ncbi:hypothetical protein [Escherichia coli]|uniref:hypothetical protein n=1 Tax=Escherichia coli TaxID=562 RepID=UPI0028526FCA|nr:hypothetical protein [Escherichia coli]
MRLQSGKSIKNGQQRYKKRPQRKHESPVVPETRLTARGIRYGQRHYLVFQFPIRQANFTALSEGFRQVVSSVENDYIQRFKNIVETCGDLDNEIKEKVEEGKNDLKETSVEVKEKLTDDIIELISGIKRNQEKNNKLYEEKLKSLSKAVKPFSTRTAIAICALCTLCLSAAFSGATWYVAQHEKEASLRFYARAFLDMKKITEESMRKLPKSDQQNIKLKLDEIDSRKP